MKYEEQILLKRILLKIEKIEKREKTANINLKLIENIAEELIENYKIIEKTDNVNEKIFNQLKNNTIKQFQYLNDIIEDLKLKERILLESPSLNYFNEFYQKINKI